MVLYFYYGIIITYMILFSTIEYHFQNFKLFFSSIILYLILLLTTFFFWFNITLLRFIHVDGYSFCSFSIKCCLAFHWMNAHYFTYHSPVDGHLDNCYTNNVAPFCLLTHLGKSFPRAGVFSVVRALPGVHVTFFRGSSR